MIFFKIYSNVAEGASVKYVSGKKMIKPASEVRDLLCYFVVSNMPFTCNWSAINIIDFYKTKGYP